MPTKARKSKKVVKKSVKQSVRQSVVVNVNSTSKRRPTNVKSMTKGSAYMGGSPYRSAYPATHNIVVNTPQPVFQSDIVNRVAALENQRTASNAVATEQQSTPALTTMPQTPLATTRNPLFDTTPIKPAEKAVTSLDEFTKLQQEYNKLWSKLGNSPSKARQYKSKKPLENAINQLREKLGYAPK